MNKIILVVCLLLAISKGEVAEENAYHMDDFIDTNSWHHFRVVQDYDLKIDNFKERYLGRLAGVNFRFELISKTVKQTNQRFDPLEMLSNFTKQCVVKYRSSLPTVLYVKNEIKKCTDKANNELSSLLTEPVTWRNKLEKYHRNYFEQELKICASEHDKSVANYTACALAVTTNTNDFTEKNKNNFDMLMNAAEYNAEKNIKIAFNCSYTVHRQVITQIGGTTVQIDKCLLNQDECQPCEWYTCRESSHIELNFRRKKMWNPFYHRKSHGTCLMLRIAEEME